MAFNDQEKELILWGKQNGKTPQEIELAISKLRAAIQPEPPPQPAQRSTAANVAIGAAKGVGDTVKGTGDLIAKGLPGAVGGPLASVPEIRSFLDTAIQGFKDKLFGAVGLTDENLKADNDAQKVGKGVAFAAELATPLAATKIAAGAKAGAAVIGKGAQATAKVTENAAGYASGRLPKLLGIFTGESDDVIRPALRDPKAADIGIEGGDEALRAAVREGSTNSIKIRNTFVQAHKEAKAKVLGQYAGVLEPKNNVIGRFNTLLRDNGVRVNKDGTLDFTTSKIVANPGEITKIKAAYDALKQWDKFTLDSLDDYKQLVGKLTRFADDAGVPSKSPFLGSLYNELNQIALNRLPKDVAAEYGALNKKFSETIELYDDVVDAFNSGDPFSKLANALGKNKDTMRQVLEFYAQEGGEDVLPIVAGRELAMEKTAAFGFLNPRSWIDLLISPKSQAKLTTKVGELLQRSRKAQ